MKNSGRFAIGNAVEIETNTMLVTGQVLRLRFAAGIDYRQRHSFHDGASMPLLTAITTAFTRSSV